MMVGDRCVERARANRPSRASLLLLLILLIVATASWFAVRAPSSSTLRNVVLLSIDTCRADHLSCYGFDAPTTPNIDALALEGIRFTNALSTAPITVPAHSSMMTGTTPPAHGARNNDMQLGEDAVTFAELLSAQGLNTGAVVAARVLEREAGLAQGFDSYDDQFSGTMPEQFFAQRRCGEVVGRALINLSAPQGMERRDLSPVLRGKATEHEAAAALYGECVHPRLCGCSPPFTVREGDWKYIHSADPSAAATDLLKVDIPIAANRNAEAAKALTMALEAHPGHQVLLARKAQLASIN